LAQVGVIEAPRVQLTNGLFRTIEKPTSLPTAATEYPSCRSAQSFNQGGRPKAGAELTRNKETNGYHIDFIDSVCFVQEDRPEAGANSQ
jgi:hypothetical protein